MGSSWLAVASRRRLFLRTFLLKPSPVFGCGGERRRGRAALLLWRCGRGEVILYPPGKHRSYLLFFLRNNERWLYYGGSTTWCSSSAIRLLVCPYGFKELRPKLLEFGLHQYREGGYSILREVHFPSLFLVTRDGGPRGGAEMR